MPLVNYSDSEDSDSEQPTPAPAPASSSNTSKPQKLIDRSEPRKIKVDLPSVKPEPTSQQDDAPPAKRARTAGAFSGFNSLLPAPKKPAQQNTPKAGVSLKTSSEAAFSRTPAPTLDNGGSRDEDDEEDPVGVNPVPKESVKLEAEKESPKIVGKATKFKPLSVANQKKKPVKKKDVTGIESGSGGMNGQGAVGLSKVEDAVARDAAEWPAPTKPKRSLFSVPQQDDHESTPASTGTYQAITTESSASSEAQNQTYQAPTTHSAQANPNSLQSLASDLNLTPAQRRQLFGRNANKDADVNISHFNMDAEYAYNNQLREAGEVVEHRAVKSIAPGKHSLQQLVNNARSQQDAMEDKWADGRRERGEGGSKYGWGGAR